MKQKLLRQVIHDLCYKCPYCSWEYDDNGPDGHFCNKTGQMIAKDWLVKDYQDQCKAVEASAKTLLPMTETDLKIKQDPMTIPDWCPLPDAVGSDR